MPVYEVFANTGIQCINTGIQSTTPAVWTRPQREDNGSPIGWLACKSVSGFCILAVDTSTGPRQLQHFAESENRIDNPVVRFTSIEGHKLSEAIEINILPAKAGAGNPIDVALVLDFGNCRSMGLFVERIGGATSLESITVPFRLYDHRRLGLDQYHPNALPEDIDAEVQQLLRDAPYETVFDSKFDLVRDHLPEVVVEFEKEEAVVVHPKEPPKKGGLFRKKKPPPEPQKIIKRTTVREVSDLFRDLSLLRLGNEADAFRMQIDPVEGILTGMSSPKRYLWASHALDHNFWHQILSTPKKEHRYYDPLQGPLLEYIFEDDRDWKTLPTKGSQHRPPATPSMPQYPPRAMIVLALYEIFSQAFAQCNSIAYRHETLSPRVKRRLVHLVLSFPSGMCAPEKARYSKQARKAILITSDACIRRQQGKRLPRLRMRTDEGTAGQLAYIYGEVRACGTGRRWLDFVGRPSAEDPARKGVRIASLDIGGGTTDLTIADYVDRSDVPLQTNLHCKIRYLDGMTKAGDEIVRHVLEQTIIPQLANELNVGKAKVRSFFTATGPAAFAAKKRRWISQIWIPVARSYLAIAEEENEQASFTLSDACPDDAAISDMHETMNSRDWDWQVDNPRLVPFRFQREEFERVLRRALGDMLYHFATIIASYDCDLLLLAGRTTRLPAVQRLLRWYLPFPKSRVVPLDRYHTGVWYPFQDRKRPGRIADPKSSVVVGSTVEYLCCVGYGLGGIRVEIDPTDTAERSYYWGFANAGNKFFTNADAVFSPESEASTYTFQLNNQLIIARRLSADERAEVSPIYCISVRATQDHSPIRVTLERTRSAGGEECLRPVDAEGEVDGQPAEFGRNVTMSLRTLFEDRYFLDMETFERINLEAIALD